MSQSKIKGRGRLVPTRPTGIEYQVQYGIDTPPEIRQHGRGMRATRWAKCYVRPFHARSIPDGSYFLHGDDGRVHQVRSVDGEWLHLEVIA
jgi:hypothetical protein